LRSAVGLATFEDSKDLLPLEDSKDLLPQGM